jgi:hypothetical protein
MTLFVRQVRPSYVSDTLRYGYDYPCKDADADTPAAADVDLCRLQPVTFQDVSCSDAAGAQRCYFEIMARKWCSNCLVLGLLRDHIVASIADCSQRKGGKCRVTICSCHI